jgi:2-polyprenyl-3-methyl-5-hydroxy-6-metoxy-1,4-benzoquinol methylase
MSKEEHWTRTLFVDHPELFLPGMDAHKQLACKEASQLCEILMKQFRQVPASAIKVLDLCCGIGTHAISLANDGYTVVGFDLSQHCLLKAEQLANKNELGEKRVRFHQGDLRQVFDILSEKGETDFNAILSIGNSFGYYGEKEDLQLLKDLNDLASSNCILILDVINREWLAKHCSPYGFSQISQTVQMDAKRKLNPETSFVESEWKFYQTGGIRMDKNNSTTRFLFSLRWGFRTYSLDELRELLDKSGWKAVESFSSISSLAPLANDSYHIVLIGTKKH